MVQVLSLGFLIVAVDASGGYCLLLCPLLVLSVGIASGHDAGIQLGGLPASDLLASAVPLVSSPLQLLAMSQAQAAPVLAAFGLTAPPFLSSSVPSVTTATQLSLGSLCGSLPSTCHCTLTAGQSQLIVVHGAYPCQAGYLNPGGRICGDEGFAWGQHYPDTGF